MTNETLFHELSHSLGPGTITVDVRETTVNAELKEVYSASEEGKADVMGVYNILYMMERGELPAAEREQALATYFAGIFRAVRFGIDEAHGRGAAVQYRSEEHTSELQSLMRISYAVFCLKTKTNQTTTPHPPTSP